MWLPHTRIIYANHPSYSVNYDSGSVAKRKSLLESILDGCGHADGLGRFYLFTDRGYIPTSQKVPRPEDIECVINLLRVLIELCLGPRLRLPQLNLEVNGFYQLEAWHFRYFKYLQQNSQDAGGRRQNRLQATLVPIFRSIHRCIRPDSLYLHRYKVDWKELSKAVAEALPQVDQLHESLAEDVSEDSIHYFVDDRKDNNVDLSGATGKEAVMLGLEAMRVRLMPFLQSTQLRSERICTWVGRVE